ncbi:hypothetical protein [Roseicyclus persicicus]|uniref:SRPBCC family protein n=1 Tax=Roseicyclus persicicus TaxID=2650661 RepID=A0A7X6H1B7_9RHOB|nr:hypothetical protein [Roseibacterium persicicum]NKX46203.1 hypothetical protein [Roseibacterium persicicum]
MADLRLATHLAAPPAAVAAALRRPATLVQVSRPLLEIRPVDPPRFPEVWAAGDHLVTMRLFGVLPLGRQVISVSFPAPPPGGFALHDAGHGGLARVWDHRITVLPEGDGSRYTDAIRIEAGWLTPLVAGFARVFYRHRQARLRRMAAAGFPGGA